MEHSLKAVKLEPGSSTNMTVPLSSLFDVPGNVSNMLMESSIDVKEEPIDIKVELVEEEESLFDFSNPNLLRVPTILKKEFLDNSSLEKASTDCEDLNCKTSAVAATSSISELVQENAVDLTNCSMFDETINFDNQRDEFPVNRRKLPSRPKPAEHNELLMYMMHKPEMNLFKSFTTIPPKYLWSLPADSIHFTNDFTGFGPESSSLSAHKIIKIRDLIQNCCDSEEDESILSRLYRKSENFQCPRSREYFSGVATNRPIRRIKRKRYFDECSDDDSDASCYSPPKKQRSLQNMNNAFQEAIESFEILDSQGNVSYRNGGEKSLMTNSTKTLLAQITGQVDDYYDLELQNYASPTAAQYSGITQVPLTYKSPARKNYHPFKKVGINQHHYNVRSSANKSPLKDESPKKMSSPPTIDKYNSMLVSLKKQNLDDIIKRQAAEEEKIKARLCNKQVNNSNKQESDTLKNCLINSSSGDGQSICSSVSPEVILQKLTHHSVNKEFAVHHQVSIKSAALIYLQLLTFEKSPHPTECIYPSTTMYEDESSSTEDTYSDESYLTEDTFDPVTTRTLSLRECNSSDSNESEEEIDQQVMDSTQQEQFENMPDSEVKNNTLLITQQHSQLAEDEPQHNHQNEQLELSEHAQQVELVKQSEHVQQSECTQEKHVQHLNHTKYVNQGPHVEQGLKLDCLQLVDNAVSEHSASHGKEHVQQEKHNYQNDHGNQNEEFKSSLYREDHLPPDNDLFHKHITRDFLDKFNDLHQVLDSHHDNETPNTDILYHGDDLHLDSSSEKEHAMHEDNNGPSDAVDDHLGNEDSVCVNQSQSNIFIKNNAGMQNANMFGAIEHVETSTQAGPSKMSTIQNSESSGQTELCNSHISLSEQGPPTQEAESSRDAFSAQRDDALEAKLYTSILLGKTSATIEQTEFNNVMQDASNDCLLESSIPKTSCPAESIQSPIRSGKAPHSHELMATGSDIGLFDQQNLNMVQRKDPKCVSSLQQTKLDFNYSSTQVKNFVGKVSTFGLDKTTKCIPSSPEPLKSIPLRTETDSLHLHLSTQGAASTTCSQEKLSNVKTADRLTQCWPATISTSKETTSSTTRSTPDLVTIDSDEEDNNDDLQVISENVKKVARSTLRLTLVVPQLLKNQSVSDITKQFSIVKKCSNGLAQEVTLQNLIENCDSTGKVYLKRKTTNIESQLDNSDDIQCLGEVPSATSQTQNMSSSIQGKDSVPLQESLLLGSGGSSNPTSTNVDGASSLSSSVILSMVPLPNFNQTSVVLQESSLLEGGGSSDPTSTSVDAVSNFSSSVTQSIAPPLDSTSEKRVEQYLRRFQSLSNESQRSKPLSLIGVTPRPMPVVAVVQPLQPMASTSSNNTDLLNDSSTNGV